MLKLVFICLVSNKNSKKISLKKHVEYNEWWMHNSKNNKSNILEQRNLIPFSLLPKNTKQNSNLGLFSQPSGFHQ